MDSIKQFLFEASDTSKKEKVVKCIIKYGDKILILRRAANTPGEGSWDLPGGMLKENEKPEDGVKREVKEETTLELKNLKSKKVVTIKDNETGPINSQIYTADAVNDAVYLPPSTSNREKFAFWNAPKPEHSEFKWIKYQDELEPLRMVDDYKVAILSMLKERQT